MWDGDWRNTNVGCGEINADLGAPAARQAWEAASQKTDQIQDSVFKWGGGSLDSWFRLQLSSSWEIIIIIIIIIIIFIRLQCWWKTFLRRDSRATLSGSLLIGVDQIQNHHHRWDHQNHQNHNHHLNHHHHGCVVIDVVDSWSSVDYTSAEAPPSPKGQTPAWLL